MVTLPEPPATDNIFSSSRSRFDRFRSHRCSDVCQSLTLDDVQQTKFFAGRSQEFMAAAIDFFELETFVEGDRIMKEGEDGDKLLFLYRGKVDVLIGAQELKVATLPAGSVVGEMALLGAPKRTATIKAAEFCDCRVLKKHTFQRLLKKFPDERAFFEQMARDRMEQLEQVKKDNPSAVRTFRLPSLHAEGKQRLRKKALPKACQAAVDKFLAVRRKSTGAISANEGISEIAPRIHTDPCLYNFEPESTILDDDVDDDDRFKKGLSAVAEQAVAKFLALRRGSNATAPRIHTEPTLDVVDELDDEGSSDDDERFSCPAKVAKDYLSLRRRSAPAEIIREAPSFSRLARIDSQCFSESEDEGAPAVESNVARTPFGIAAKVVQPSVPDTRSTHPPQASTLNFRRRLVCGSRKLPELSGNVTNLNGDLNDHKNLLYNVVACQL